MCDDSKRQGGRAHSASCCDDFCDVKFGSLQHAIGECRKMMECCCSWKALDKPSFIHGYKKLHVAIVVHFRISAEPRDYYLVFHSVPPRYRHGKRAAARSRDVRVTHTSDVGTECKADSMLSVGYLGEFPDKVIASGVPLTSWVWLEPAQCWPKIFGVDRDLGFFVALRDAAFEIRWVVSPGKVNVFLGGSVPESLVSPMHDGIKGVTRQRDRLSPLSGQSIRDGELADVLDDMFPGLRINLFDATEVLSTSEAPRGDIEFLECFATPVDVIIGGDKMM